MRFKETEFGEVVLKIDGGEHYLVEMLRDEEDFNTRCEEFCSLQEFCHRNSICGRELCRCFDSGLEAEFCFDTKDPSII
jgi:hypothetical protein